MKSVKEANGRISFVILGVYADDIIPVPNNSALLKAEKAALNERFEMIDQVEIHYLLGMSIKRDKASRTLIINQPNYVEKVLNKFGVENYKPVSTPLESGRKFSSYHQVMSPSISRPINRQLDVGPMCQQQLDRILLLQLEFCPSICHEQARITGFA